MIFIMKIPRALGLIVIAGIAVGGFFLGRATREDTPREQTNAGGSPAPLDITPARNNEPECDAERTELTSIKAQLAACMTPDTAAPEAAPPGAPERPGRVLSSILAEEINQYQKRLESLSEAVIVRRSDGTIYVYKPDEWPTDGDGVIVGRKFSDGRIERYPSGARPSAPR